ncbi:MAG: protein kinase domain-containing protein [Candidatus Eiseniibacteriota bacterium]
MSLATGSRLGPYQVIAPLGAGGMGEVYRAHDARLSRDVAIKTLPPEFASDPDRLARFEREARLLASLNHPHLATIYGLELANGTPHLVLELIVGETLAGRIARGALEWREALAVCGQVAAAIEAAHERGIVHRDLKPGNVMITASGVVKVLDFGLAKGGMADTGDSSSGARAGSPAPSQLETMLPAERATEIGMVLGTAAYMSPEQARGKAVDRRCDVWAFGCMVYECLTGRRAFEGQTTSDLVARILEREPDWTALPPATPPRLRELLRRCLRKDADARPRDIRDVRVELAEIAASGAASANEKSIAVLPFENQSGADDEYFSDGVTDEILNALAHVEGLRVAARTSCFAFKGKREDLRTVAERLDVATVLEGSVRRSGSRLRIHAQLVNAADGYQLWSERYDREMTDVFEVQDEIATAIATRLRGSMQQKGEHAAVRRGTENLEAYELFLRGRAIQGRRGRFLNEAIDAFEKALVLDPNYAEAMAWLSDSYRLMSTFGSMRHADGMNKAKALAERALTIDPMLAEAWTTLASIEDQFEWNFALGAEHYRRALELDPRHARARAQRVLWSYLRGAMPEAQANAEMTRSIADDPLNAWIGAMHAFLLGFSGRHPEAIAEAERSVALDRDSFFARWIVMCTLAWGGHHDRAIEHAPALLRESGRHPWVLGLLAWTYGQLGQPDKARAILDELEARGRLEFMAPHWLATAASAAGLEDRAVQYMKLAVEQRDSLMLWTRLSPLWEQLRKHPKYLELTHQLWG